MMGAAMKVVPCDFVGKCMADPKSYASEVRYGVASMKRISEIADQRLADAWLKTKEVHTANAEAIEHNTALAKSLTEMMIAAGIPDGYLAPKRGSRSYPPKKIRLPAGYLGDIARNIITNDGFAYAEIKYNGLAAKYAEYRTLAAGEQERIKVEKERASAAELERRRADIGLAKIILRYEFPDDIMWEDVLERLRERDKYLDLAIAGLLTRGDWSDGFYRVESALGRFKIADDRDKEIAADLCGCLSDNDGDGRIFRDTKWSYDRIFALVADSQLRDDAMLALNNSRDN